MNDPETGTRTVLSTSPSFGTRTQDPVDLLRAAGCEAPVAPGLDRADLVPALLTPPTYLEEQSVVTCEIERLGRLENPVTRCGSTGVAT